MQRDMRPLEYGLGPHRELVAAFVAQEHSGRGLARHAMDVARATVGAVDTLRPAVGFHVGRGLGLIVKDRVGELDGHGGKSLSCRHSLTGRMLSQVYSCHIFYEMQATQALK